MFTTQGYHKITAVKRGQPNAGYPTGYIDVYLEGYPDPHRFYKNEEVVVESPRRKRSKR